jgi:hypothetical protein
MSEIVQQIDMEKASDLTERNARDLNTKKTK